MSNVETIRCFKCQGERVLRPFMHIDAGRCFACGGLGVVEVTLDARPVSMAPSTCLDALRSLYRAGRSRIGADRTDWIESIGERFDAYSDVSPLSLARKQIERVASEDASKAVEVRAAFATLGVQL